MKMYKNKIKKVSLTSPHSKLEHSNSEIWGKEQGFFQYCDEEQNLYMHLQQWEFHQQDTRLIKFSLRKKIQPQIRTHLHRVSSMVRETMSKC